MTLGFGNNLRFEAIVGQERAVEFLRRAHAADRLPHALIFSGPAGVGKGTTAGVLGALFLCEKPKGDNPCGACASCRVLAAGNHPDYHVIYRQLVRIEKKDSAARDLSVDVIRKYVIEFANLTSALGRGKVFVIEEAELMNSSAQNALLKTLEEPFSRTLLVLLTDQPESLLPTVRSRCQLVRFAPLSSELIVRELGGRGIKAADAEEAARLADGSLGLAIRWMEDGVLEQARELRAQVEQLLAGRAPADLAGWFKGATEGYVKRQLERDSEGSKDQAAREGMGLYLRLMARLFRQRLAGTDRGVELERVCGAIEALARAEAFVNSNVNLALIFQHLAVRLEGLCVAPAAGPRSAARQGA